MMPDKWKRTFMMWSNTDEYEKKVIEANKIIKDCFNQFKNPYLAFSGGKDSVAMLHLVLQIMPDIPVWLWDHGPYLIPRSMQNEIEENAKNQGVKIKNLFVRTSGQLNNPDARWDYMRWYRTFFSNLSTLIDTKKWDCVFLGIRREESGARKIRARDPFNYTIDRKIPQCYPLHEWTWRDVWACIISNNLPYLSHYDTYGAVQGYDKTRLCTFFDDEFQHKNSIDGILMPEFRNL
jgi:3'-phosphoadenosine 5'-phosphosulfate sulfotransferase (PAPS reductase)/FAD synthetase